MMLARVQLPWPPSATSPNASGQGKWRAEDDAMLVNLHGSMSLSDVASAIGRTEAAVKWRITKLGIASRRMWTAEEEAGLTKLYADAGPDGVVDLAGYASRVGRSRSNVCRKARHLGLITNSSRKKVEVRKVKSPKFQTEQERRAAMSKRAKQQIAEKGHPRGMAGKAHSPEVKAALAAAYRDWWSSLNDEQREAHTMKALRAKVEKHGSIAPNVKRGAWKAGWREVGGKRIFFRSRWEANYARYLEWLRGKGQISSWEHEPETFWFENIKRGVRSYLPDFYVSEVDGASAYHEVKGWMDSRSRTTISRFRKYYPHHHLIVIDGAAYRSIERTAASLIPDWEGA